MGYEKNSGDTSCLDFIERKMPMPDPLSSVRTRNPQTPASERALPTQVPNSGGGWSFQVGDAQRALRFLILGTDGGTYYASEKDLTKDNAEVILRMAQTDGETLVKLIVDVSTSGRAPRQNPTLFALAACTASVSELTRQAAFAAIPQVCRTGTMLFIFARYVEQFRGWGRGLRKAIGNWYLNPTVEQVAYQAVKYRQREGWSHRDLLRLSHPKAHLDRADLFDWICRPTSPSPSSLLGTGIPIIEGYTLAQECKTVVGWVQLIERYDLSWEMLPDAAMKEPQVWEALIPKMGLTALLRNLGRLSSLGVLKPLSIASASRVVARLTDPAEIKRARLHPLKVLDALETYRSGHGLRGKLTWTPVPQIVDALDKCFYLSFGAVTPANKRTLIALDVSASMGWGTMANSNLTPRVASGAMAMVTARTEPQYFIMAFAHEMVPVNITAGHSLSQVTDIISRIPFGATNCSLPMSFAAHNKLDVDTFIVLTDNETNTGYQHPHEALDRYRQLSGIPAKEVVVGMTATHFTIANPEDPGTMDVVGFDVATPELISSFSRGDF